MVHGLRTRYCHLRDKALAAVEGTVCVLYCVLVPRMRPQTAAGEPSYRADRRATAHYYIHSVDVKVHLWLLGCECPLLC